LLNSERNELISAQLKARGLDSKGAIKDSGLIDTAFSDFIINGFYELFPSCGMNGRIPWDKIKQFFEFHGFEDYQILNICIQCIRNLEIVYNGYIQSKNKES
jgi:hypothetical protein